MKIFQISTFFYSCMVDARTARKMGWVGQHLNTQEDCGIEILAEDKDSGFIETTHYYIKEDEEEMKCRWNIKTNCDQVQWMFDKFNFEVKTGSYYDSIFPDMNQKKSAEDEAKEKLFNCLTDNVQVQYNSKKTKKFCAFDDSNDYDDEDFNKLYDDPTGTPVMQWTTLPGSDFQINYQTKHLIYGFKLNWRCVDSSEGEEKISESSDEISAKKVKTPSKL